MLAGLLVQIVLLDSQQEQSVADKVMNRSLLLELISEHLDINSVHSLSEVCTSLQASISRLQSNYWWYRRTQTLLKSTLEGETNESWKHIYRSLCTVLQSSVSSFTRHVLSSVQCTRLLLAYPLKYSGFFYSNTLEYACVIGEIGVVTLLLNDSRVRTTVRISNALRLTCTRGRVEIFKLILEDVMADPSRHDSSVLDDACGKGRTEIVELLLQDGRADPSATNSHSLDLACYRGHVEIVYLLLEDGRADPSACNYEAVLSALKKEHQEIVDLLVADPRVGMTGLNIARARLNK